MRTAAVVLCALAAGGAAAAPAGVESLYALRYGTSLYGETAVFADGVKGKEIPFHWIFYVLRIGGAWVVVDPGFSDSKLVKSFGVAWTDPLSLMERIPLKAADVDVLIITHAHFDHVGLVDAFPKARIVISQAALDAVTYPRAKAFLGKSKAVESFTGRVEALPGLWVEEVGGHAAGSSVVRMADGAASIVLTGDEAYVAANWTGPRGNGSVIDPERNLSFLRALKAEVDAGTAVAYTMHDPAVAPGRDPVRRLR